jgi:hypothetical protein
MGANRPFHTAPTTTTQTHLISLQKHETIFDTIVKPAAAEVAPNTTDAMSMPASTEEAASKPPEVAKLSRCR